ncbi:hypothetical protein D3C72_1873500 [compost metagenome]
MPEHRGEADPGLLLDAKAAKIGDQDRQQAFAQVAEQGQDRKLLSRHPQHVGGARVAGTLGTWVARAEQTAEQNGEGQRSEQVGESRQQPKHGIHSGARKSRF